MHPDAELGPRDVVARAIFEQMQRGRTVGLDARHVIGERFPEEFPTVFGFCMSAGIDPRIQNIPVAPAAHYHMGGVAVDKWGRTTLPRLWACGETSATGVHGANRLASNSLLEALVYGSRVAADIANADARVRTNRIAGVVGASASDGDAQAISDLRNVMYTNVGLVRHERGLREALGRIRELEQTFAGGGGDLRNLLVVGRLVAEAALARHESRGSHFRSDFAEADEALAKRSFTRLANVV